MQNEDSTLSIVCKLKSIWARIIPYGDYPWQNTAAWVANFDVLCTSVVSPTLSASSQHNSHR